VGETLAPSVRRQLRPVLGLVLISTGFAANVPLICLALVTDRLVSLAGWSSGLVAAVTGGGAALDTFLIWRGKPRPWAVRSQVPQWWGHSFGPWWGSARYGLRLGFGPATLLNSWLWWAGVVVLFPFPLGLTAGLSVFVTIRTLTILAASWGISSGHAMARRAKVLDSATATVRYGAVLAVLGAAIASLAWGRLG
jgi:hypothetical protein